MGRDFTPRQLHYADLTYGFSKQKQEIHSLDGKNNKMILYDPEGSMEKRFPNLSFLTDGFRNIYATESLEGWDDIEKKVAAVVEQDSENAVTKEDGYIWKWYAGELDPYFYYKEDNEVLFLEQALKRIKENPKI